MNEADDIENDLQRLRNRIDNQDIKLATLRTQQAELVKALTTISLVENYEQNFFEMQKIARNALAKVKGDA